MNKDVSNPDDNSFEEIPLEEYMALVEKQKHDPDFTSVYFRGQFVEFRVTEKISSRSHVSDMKETNNQPKRETVANCEKRLVLPNQFMDYPKYEYRKAPGEEHYEIVRPDNDLIEDLQDASEELNDLAAMITKSIVDRWNDGTPCMCEEDYQIAARLGIDLDSL